VKDLNLEHFLIFTEKLVETRNYPCIGSLIAQKK